MIVMNDFTPCSEIMRHHAKIPELVACKDLVGCVEASKAKLELLLSLGTQLITGRNIFSV